jgi:hypothetical protein
MPEILFENSSWVMIRISSREVKLKSKAGLGTASAFLVGREYDHSFPGLYNSRGGRIGFRNKAIIPSYCLSKITAFFRQRGQRYR